MARKYSSVKTTNTFKSNGEFSQSSGNIQLSSDSATNNVQVGSAFMKGNKVRDLISICSDQSPRNWNLTSDDKAAAVDADSLVFAVYPNLTQFPFLHPLENEEDNHKSPVVLGKCSGEIEWYSAAAKRQAIAPSTPALSSLQAYRSITFLGPAMSVPAPELSHGEVPHSGLITAGTIVQFHFTREEEHTSVSVTPYYSGRGVPQYDPTDPFFSGNAFGIPRWPGAQGNHDIEPRISSGLAPGDNNMCVGVVVDTAMTSNTTPRVYRYASSENINRVFPESDQHPAPSTIPPQTIADKTLSAGPNAAGVFGAPWPYSYKENEPVPVLTRGAAAVRVGAALNIGMQAYYEPPVAPGDDPVNNKNYVAVSIVPLFQGEMIIPGSEVFVSAMGHAIGGKAIGYSPYPVGSFSNACGAGFVKFRMGLPEFKGISRNGLEENPWFEWNDPTFGAHGWTSTPAFSFKGLPDTEKTIASTRFEGSYPYLYQSLCGTSIVHAVNTVDSADEVNGSGRMQLLSEAIYNKKGKGKGIVQVPCIGERALALGHSLGRGIQGKGQWPWTGTMTAGGPVVCGHGYAVDDVLVCKGTTRTVKVTAVDAQGAILSLDTLLPGSGYIEGGIYDLEGFLDNNSVSGYRNGKRGGVARIVSASVTDPAVGGTGNKSVTGGAPTFNLSSNSLVIELKVTKQLSDLVGSTIDSITAVSGWDQSYPVGTQFYITDPEISHKYSVASPLAVGVVKSLSPLTLELVNIGDQSVYKIGTFLYATKRVWRSAGPTVSIRSNGDGQVQSVRLSNLGTGNRAGDRILLVGSNAVFTYPDISEECAFHLLEGGSAYYYYGQVPYPVPVTNVALIMDANNQSLTDTALELGRTSDSGSMYTARYTSKFFNIFDPVRASYPAFKDLRFSTQYSVLSSLAGLSVEQPGGISPLPLSRIHGWDSYRFRATATFQLSASFHVLDGGTGFRAGSTHGVDPGGGVVMVVEVDDNGAVIRATVEDPGDTEHGEEVQIFNGLPGNPSLCKGALIVTNTDSVTHTFDNTDGYYTMMVFKADIIIPGRQYVADSDALLGTRVNNLFLIESMQVTVDNVDADGGVTRISVRTEGKGYRNGDVVLVNSGDGQCAFRLVSVTDTVPFKLTTGGIGNYVAGPAKLVSYDIIDMLNPICIFDGGQCVPQNYGDETIKPLGWDVSKLLAGDTVTFEQLSVTTGIINRSASATVQSINYVTQAVSFSNINPGSNYEIPFQSKGFPQTVVERLYWDDAPNCAVELGPNGLVSGITAAAVDVVPGTHYAVVQDRDLIPTCAVQYRPDKDVPAPFILSENNRKPTSTEWNDYATVMKSATNLVDKTIAVNVFPSYPHYMNSSYYVAGDGGMDHNRTTPFM